MFLVSFFVHPETALWVDGRLFVSDIGEFNKRDGKVYVRKGSNWEVYAPYLNDPKGLAYCGGSLYVADVDRIWMVKDKATVFLLVGPKDFSAKFLNGITCYAGKKLYVSDTYGNAIFEVDLSRKTVRKILDVEKPNGLTLDPSGNLYIITFTEPGRILRWDGKNLDTLFVNDDISGGDGIIYDPESMSIIASGYESGKVVLIGSDGKHRVLFENLRTPAGIGFDGKTVYIPLLEEGKVLEKRIR
jgi:sugar lactone lactonase YvrE